jgi:hypothetical protein
MLFFKVAICRVHGTEDTRVCTTFICSVDGCFFLNQGRSQRDLKSFIKQWCNSYMMDQREKINYRSVQTLCTKDSKTIRENVIGSCSITTASTRPSTAEHVTAGDKTT